MEDVEQPPVDDAAGDTAEKEAADKPEENAEVF